MSGERDPLLSPKDLELAVGATERASVATFLDIAGIKPDAVQLEAATYYYTAQINRTVSNLAYTGNRVAEETDKEIDSFITGIRDSGLLLEICNDYIKAAGQNRTFALPALNLTERRGRKERMELLKEKIEACGWLDTSDFVTGDRLKVTSEFPEQLAFSRLEGEIIGEEETQYGMTAVMRVESEELATTPAQLPHRKGQIIKIIGFNEQEGRSLIYLNEDGKPVTRKTGENDDIFRRALGIRTLGTTHTLTVTSLVINGTELAPSK